MNIIVHTSDGPQMITTPAMLAELLPTLLFAGVYWFEVVREEEKLDDGRRRLHGRDHLGR